METSTPIAGIYEVCIGVEDAMPLIQYWAQFGYAIGQTGELSPEQAFNLYGVNSSLRSFRLFHQDSDHGLVRLMIWENPTNEGLKLSSMKLKGNRWTTTLTADLMNILNHTEAAVKAGLPIVYTFPYWEIIYNQDRPTRPFIDSPTGVREMLLLQPLTRQVLFQRFNYSLTDYGKINEGAPFKASQITHLGIIVQDDSKEILRFYEETLGLLRVRDDDETTYNSSAAAREFFDLQPPEKLIVTAFDDPRSSTDFKAARSGRLYIIRFPESMNLESCFEKAQPGCLGMSLYTYRVSDIEEYFHRIKESNVKRFSEIEINEFGEKSFSFVAPDGYFWTLIAK
ncbi:VOC family protein [Aerosakkonemataceae cyanobacterium BLCC-F154]|uniref:VOC family protein n=1 Tax=Floridaenema fluviatile BLCC-F154 TaxID=3153640 RepID=A0ABV4YJC4_9CYAN